eukprot:scaffold3551_cov408-Prasinococcus_capsulatus_cf.AAC.1
MQACAWLRRCASRHAPTAHPVQQASAPGADGGWNQRAGHVPGDGGRHACIDVYMPACLPACLRACVRACLHACMEAGRQAWTRLRRGGGGAPLGAAGNCSCGLRHPLLRGADCTTASDAGPAHRQPRARARARSLARSLLACLGATPVAHSA